MRKTAPPRTAPTPSRPSNRGFPGAGPPSVRFAGEGPTRTDRGHAPERPRPDLGALRILAHLPGAEVIEDMPGLLAQIEEHEGFRAHAYRDSLGFLTIGIGRLVDERRGGGISREEARTLLLHDLQAVFDGLDQRLPWWRDLDEIRKHVIVDMAFNLGVGGLLKFRTTLEAVKSGCWDEAAKGMLKSRWAGQVGRRARRLAAMMRTGQPVALEGA